MSVDSLVYWAVTGIVGGAAGVAILIAAWLLKSHLSLVREFDQFKGFVGSNYATVPSMKEAVAAAIKPLEKEVERLISQSEQIGEFLRELAADRHVTISAARRE